MLYPSDITQLINQWSDRITNYNSNSEYADGIRDCIFDLNNLLLDSYEEEDSYQEFLSQQADNYLSTIEAHEAIA